jgi:hypothetical protein
MPDTNTPSKSKPHENDILIVHNPDVDCDVIDTEENYSHKDYFQVRWSGHPHRIPPGQTRRMPRFLAEHYAKHLADHMLMKMEEETGRKGLVQSSFERPRMLEKIILGVDTYFLGESEVEEGEKVSKIVDELNPVPDERPLDLGEIPNPAVGVLKPEPKPIVVEDEPKTSDSAKTTEVKVETSLYDPKKPKPTKKELIADCEKLGIEITGKETVDQLIGKIKAF